MSPRCDDQGSFPSICRHYLGKPEAEALGPSQTLSFLRFLIIDLFSASALTSMGIAMVESQWTVAMLASWAILPQLCASSKVHPESPPQCGARP